MSQMTHREAIVKALEARGEKRVEDRSLSKWWKYTRTWKVARSPSGELQRCDPASAGTFFFVNRSVGGVRVGFISTGSRVLPRQALDILIMEGKKLP